MTSDTYSFNGNAYNVWDYNEEGDNGYNNNDSSPLYIMDLKKNYAL